MIIKIVFFMDHLFYFIFMISVFVFDLLGLHNCRVSISSSSATFCGFLNLRCLFCVPVFTCGCVLKEVI